MRSSRRRSGSSTTPATRSRSTNPLNWNVGWFNAVFDELTPGGIYWTVFLRTFAYVLIAGALSLLIGYPVAYYVARQGGRTKACCCLLIVRRSGSRT